MTETFTAEQRAAIEHAGSVVLAAGAGSGKTRVLVERYLRHLENHDVRNLVAITFTDRAAREMRRRIRAGLEARLQSCQRGSALHDRWLKHRRDLDSAAIDTIHGFCTTLLRRFAKFVNLDPSFTVLEALYTAPLRDEVIEDTLQTILLGTGPLTNDLHECYVLYGRLRVEESIRDLLAEPDRAAWAAFDAEPVNAVLARWTDAFTAMRQEHATHLVQQLAGPVKLRHILRMRNLPKEGARIIADILTRLDAIAVDYRSVDLDALKGKAMIRYGPKAKHAYGEANTDAVRLAFNSIRYDLCDALHKSDEIPPHLERAVLAARRMVRVALAVDAAYSARKAAANVVDFHDLLRKAHTLLAEHPEACEHLQKQYKIFLLDELQDTDPLQMAIADMLTGSRKWAGGLFAVGDAKQSIYRFRGAEVALFAALRAEAPAESRLELTANFRSVPGILQFVNALCEAWFPEESKLVPHKPAEVSAAVEFLWAVASDDRANMEALRTLEAKTIAARILELTDGDAPFCRRHEITILFRAMSQVAIYERALLDAGIDYYLVGGRAFFAQQEVYDLFYLFCALENPFDSLALTAVLRSPFCGLNDEAVLALGLHTSGPWTALADEATLALLPTTQQANARRAHANLTQWRAQKDSLPIARLLQLILNDSGYDAALLFEPLGERKLANLWKLADIAREFDRLHTSLAEFVVRLQDLLTSQPKEEQAATLPEQAEHVVRLMSIHQAKGLEFPVVFVPDLSRRAHRGEAHGIWWHRDWRCALASVPPDFSKQEIEAGEPFPEWPSKLGVRGQTLADARETRRVFYVACTRAERKLILSAGVTCGDPVEPAGPFMCDLSRVYDLTTGRCELSSTSESRVSVRLVQEQNESKVPDESDREAEDTFHTA